jgi:hypothetical protein
VLLAATKTGAREGQGRLWVIQANAGGESGVAFLVLPRHCTDS